ncbi:MAG: cell division protein FtsL [Pseudomonadales bacterium]|jgi:cell division protein FtsL
MSSRAFLAWLLALLFLVLSGVQVAFSTDAVRERHMALQSLQSRLDAAAEEYSRLQIELAAVAAYQNVERAAADKLGMSFPEDVERVEP